MLQQLKKISSIIGIVLLLPIGGYSHPNDIIKCNIDDYIKKIGFAELQIYASSEKENEGSYSYSVKNVLDGNLSTCWCPKGNGLDQFIIIKIPYKSKGIRLLNGLVFNDRLYNANTRIKELYLGFVVKKEKISEYDMCPKSNYDVVYQTSSDSFIQLKDDMKWKDIIFDKIDGFSWDSDFERHDDGVYLIIGAISIYKGTKYNDLCISEIEIIK